MAVDIGSFPYARIFRWNAGATLMDYAWRGKLWMAPHPMAMHWACVRAEDYSSIVISFYADGVLLMQKSVLSDAAFRLPVRNEYDEIDWVATGTSRVWSVEIADQLNELSG